jgi:hypothetical protein
MKADTLIPDPVTPKRTRLERRTTRRRLLHGLALALCLTTVTARAQQPAAQPLGPEAPATASELEALRGELRKQEAERAQRLAADEAAIDRLGRELAAERAQRQGYEARLEELQHEARAAADQPLVHAGRFGLRLWGFAQIDAIAYSQAAQDQLNPATGAPLNDVRFFLRRARLRLDVDWRMVAGAVEFDGNTTNGYQARIIGVEASLVWRNPRARELPWLQLTVGSFKIPFGFEVGQRDIDRLFLERSIMEHAFFPGEYDLGARLFGGWRFLRYSLAAMNGDPIGEKLFPGRDPNQSKDLIGRLGIDLPMNKLSVAGSFSALWGQGFHPGTPQTKDTLVWRDTNQDGAVQINEITVIPGQAPTPSQNFNRWAVGGELRATLLLPRVGALTLSGELVYATNLDRALLIADPVAAARDLRELGFYVAATQDLTEWAAVGVRYERYDPDRDGNDLRGGVQVPKDGSYTALTFTGALRYKGYARLIAQYDHNTNALGRTTDGTPTTLASDQFTLRGEVRF